MHFLLGFTGLHPAIAGRVCPFRPTSGRTTRCVFCGVLLGFTLPSQVGCVQRSQRRLRARSHRPQHRPEKGGWLRECTGRDSFCQRCDRTCEIHLGANRQELMYFSVAIVVVLILDFDPTIAPSRRMQTWPLRLWLRGFRVHSPRGSCWGSERWDTLLSSK